MQEEASEEIALDLVIRQDPAPGTELTEGSVVTIVVSVGAEVVAVPDVLGQDIFTATQELAAAGFNVQQEQAEDPTGVFSEGQVWQQTPPAGTEAPRGSSVLIRVVPVETTTTSPVIVTQAPPPPTSPPATSPPPTSPPPTTPPTTP